MSRAITTDKPRKFLVATLARRNQARLSPTQIEMRANPPRLGARRMALKKSGWTVKKLARRLGLCEGSIRSYLRHGCESYTRAQQMSDLLDCELDLFLFR